MIEKEGSGKIFFSHHFLAKLRSFFFFFSYSRRILGHDGGEGGKFIDAVWKSPVYVICKGGSVNGV